MDEKLIQELVVNNNEITLIEEQISKKIASFQKELNLLKIKDQELKDAIKLAMESGEVTKFENDKIAITYIAPTTRKTLDSAAIKENEPAIYEKYIKISNVKSSVRITIK